MYFSLRNTFVLASCCSYSVTTNAFTNLQTRKNEYRESSSLLMSRQNNDENIATVSQKRRDVMLSSFGLLSSAAVLWTSPIEAFAANMPGVQDTVNIDQFLRTGVDGGGNMGVSSQAGKSRPETGVILRDGADVFRDKGTGDVLAEILIGTKLEPVAIVASFRSPWPLATGSVFDVECRDAKTGDGTFMAVTDNVGGKSLEELPSDFFMERLFNPAGRFSFYGAPTDIKVKKSRTEGLTRYMEVSFSNLSQSTNSEIPRKAIVAATIPKGSNNAVMLVASSSTSRWLKGSEKDVRSTIESFQAIPAPKTSLKLRAKDRNPLGTL
uniref:Uncharacterized protein n=1 Tax=Proboscia inermis TaxID=420281 RepID=A0A7S0CCE2_9STRA|mmetsp:Transcript_38328/g.38708  ORF Transcript_38328/g.38708 Transcript_38328/m.38708 type:complete len:324 (+) Transcript_38328:86-1057(+)